MYKPDEVAHQLYDLIMKGCKENDLSYERYMYSLQYNLKEIRKIDLLQPNGPIKSLDEVKSEMKYGDVYTTKKFKEMIDDGYIIDDDGCGYIHNGIEKTELDVFEYYSELDKFPYVCWYNK